MAYRAAVCDDSAGKYYELWNPQAQYDTKEPAEVCTKFPQKNYTFHQKAARIVNSSGERLEKNRNPVYNESKVSRIMRQKSTELRDPMNAAKKEGRSTL